MICIYIGIYKMIDIYIEEKKETKNRKKREKNEKNRIK
mgnify:CR=1 FL=1